MPKNVLEHYIDYLKAERSFSPYTIRNYRSDLVGNKVRGREKGFFQFLESRHVGSLKKVDRVIMRDYIGYLMEQKIAKRSISRKLSAVRSFYRYLLREGYIQQNPIKLTTSPKMDRRLPDFLSATELDRLLSAPDTSTPKGLRDRAILELIYASGMRVSELAGLDISQVASGTGEIRVTGKGSKERVVLIGAPAVKAVQDYLERGRPKLVSLKGDRTALFINRFGTRLSQRSVQSILAEYAMKAGLGKRVYPHLLRHSFATHMLDGGADLRVVQELLGHTNLGTTQIYTHVTQTQAKKVYLASHPMAKKDDQA